MPAVTKIRNPRAIEKLIADCTLLDRQKLRRRLFRQLKNSQEISPGLQVQIEQARARRARRLAQLPDVTYNPTLPVSARIDQISQTLAREQVVILCGETGSGKTTQLPKLCLAMGRGVDGQIGHTQPRRIAARSVAARIADELGCSLGDKVGYKIRYTDNTSDNTCIKVMTDGVLLVEIQKDRDLLQYDTLIIDEAHERSLNIDFLLGYIRQLLPRRPDLKLIITSATIDVDRFSTYFNDAPIIEISGRTYPVEVLYRPIEEKKDSGRDIDLEQIALLGAINELSRYGHGDILVFLEGEREIHETARYLNRQHLGNTDILPLYSRLSQSRQSEIFKPHKRRHIILATNVAETSLTIPGIHYVIDTGYARISRYSRRNKVQQLPVEKISRAAAEQRKGRCGRVANGVCIRLYAEPDFDMRPEFTDPEIIRTNLAAVILQMKALNLGDIKEFPFLTRPDARYINDGLGLLVELQAIDKAEQCLTRLGKKLSRLPVDPRLGRIILAAEQSACVHEALIITSALSAQDCRERPLEAQEKADKAHLKFNDENSDFMSCLNIWNFYHDQVNKLSENKLRKLCARHYLSYIRIREWREIYRQLSRLVRDAGLSVNQLAADYENIHCAILAGLLSHVAVKTDAREYTGARGIKLNIFPGSGQFSKLPKWIVAAELVATSRLYARTVASINPQWLIKSAEHLINRETFDPFWDSTGKQVIAHQKLTLFGLVLVADQKVNYSKINPGEARRIFIQSGLVEENYLSNLSFIKHNHEIIKTISLQENKKRRHDLFSEKGLYDFYDRQIPAGIFGGPDLEKWYKSANKTDPSVLFISPDDVTYRETSQVTQEMFPDNVSVNNTVLPVEYEFDPGSDHDGATIEIPVFLLNQVSESDLDYIVPGMIRDKLEFILKSLPKNIRKKLVPVPDTVTDCLEILDVEKTTIANFLPDFLYKKHGISISTEQVEKIELPDYLKINLKIVDENMEILGQGRDLRQLKNDYSGSIQNQFNSVIPDDFEKDGLITWDFGDIPGKIEYSVNGIKLYAYPALLDQQDSVSIRLYDTTSEANQKTLAGLRRLFMLELAKDYRYLKKNLPDSVKMGLLYTPIAEQKVLVDDILYRLTDQVFLPDRKIIMTKSEFDARKSAGQMKLVDEANILCQLIYTILGKWHTLRLIIEESGNKLDAIALADIKNHLESLIFYGFVQTVPDRLLSHYPRYLEALICRIKKLQYAPEKDQKHRLVLSIFFEAYEQLCQHVSNSEFTMELDDFRFMIEELSVSLYAQELGTAVSVSRKRLQKQLDLIRGG